MRRSENKNNAAALAVRVTCSAGPKGEINKNRPIDEVDTIYLSIHTYIHLYIDR